MASLPATGWQPQALSILRVVMGLMLLQFGVAKILKFPVLSYFAQLNTLSAIAGVLELVGGAMLLVGLFTRPVAFVLSGLMAAAYFIGHMFKGGFDAPVFLPLLNNGSLAIIFCFVCLYLSAAGGGPWSVDAMRRR